MNSDLILYSEQGKITLCHPIKSQGWWWEWRYGFKTVWQFWFLTDGQTMVIAESLSRLKMEKYRIEDCFYYFADWHERIFVEVMKGDVFNENKSCKTSVTITLRSWYWWKPLHHNTQTLDQLKYFDKHGLELILWQLATPILMTDIRSIWRE